jgi:hypothetical protein
MLRAVAIAAVCLLVPKLAAGQGGVDARRGWFYGFFAPGGMSDGGPATLHAGGGGEALIARGFGIGAELGYFARARDAGHGYGLGSLNLSYHFGGRDPEQKTVPFITAGGSAVFHGGRTQGGANIGGGIQYWMRERLGLRFEYRSHIFSSDSSHAYEFRFGLAFH